MPRIIPKTINATVPVARDLRITLYCADDSAPAPGQVRCAVSAPGVDGFDVPVAEVTIGPAARTAMTAFFKAVLAKVEEHLGVQPDTKAEAVSLDGEVRR